jgi:hypothetical protein
MNNKDLMNLGDESRRLINNYLILKGMSKNALAVKSGVHPTQLYLYLNNQRGLTNASLEKIGKILCE